MDARFIISAIALTWSAWCAPAQAAGACITDAELEAAVGADIRAGAFAVSTAKLGDRPLCSGLTMARAIQQLRERLVPSTSQQAASPAPRAPDRDSPPVQGGTLPDISRALVYDDPGYCYSEPLQTFFVALDKRGSPRLGALGPVTGSRQRLKDGQIRLYAAITARWNGLTITGLEHIYLPDTDASSFTTTFREPPSIVRPALARLGFRFGQVGSDDTMDRSVTLSSRGAGSELECAS